MAKVMRGRPLSERFWARVAKAGPDDCWLWTACRDGANYGMVGIAPGRAGRAHRVSYEIHHGVKLPPGVFVCHRCDNPPCVNPAHLFVGTSSDNNKDRAAKGRSADQRGERHPNAVLTEVLVHEIRARAAAGEQYRAIAVQLGVGRHAVYDVLRGRTWRHLA